MKDKLFNLDPTPIERVFIIKSYAGNRLAVKLMRLLKGDKIYKVKRLDSINDLTIFEASIKSIEEKKETLKLLVNEVISYIPDNFPPNYIFWVNDQPLGSVNSFSIEIDDEIVIFSHKIKEINKRSVMPEVQIYNNL